MACHPARKDERRSRVARSTSPQPQFTQELAEFERGSKPVPANSHSGVPKLNTVLAGLLFGVDVGVICRTLLPRRLGAMQGG